MMEQQNSRYQRHEYIAKLHISFCPIRDTQFSYRIIDHEENVPAQMRVINEVVLHSVSTRFILRNILMAQLQSRNQDINFINNNF